MFHIELRQFPHNTHAFNLTEAQLRGTVIAPWLREQTIDVGDRKWVPANTMLTILEGPELTTGDMAMGRGWAAARRKGRDVTRQMLAPAPPAAAALDDLTRELLSMTAADLVSVHEAWLLASTWYPGRRASDRLVAAEGAVRALLLTGHAALCRGTRATAADNVVPGPDIEALLLSVASWADDGGSSVFLTATELGRRELEGGPAASGD